MTLSSPLRWLKAWLNGTVRRRLLRRRNKEGWNAAWARTDFDAPWLDRPVPPELLEAVREGWFVPGSALDIGCGEGQIAAWLARQGFPTVGVDISAHAVRRAQELAGEVPGLRFQVADICAGPVPGGPFSVLVDRGCFHQIPAYEQRAYVRSLAAVATPGARLLLLVRAYRSGEAVGDAAVAAAQRATVEAAFGAEFLLVRDGVTYLDRHGGNVPGEALGGHCFWLERR